jgi:hypothetical protein
MNVFRKLLCISPVEDERLPTIAILRRTPLERLDETVRALKRRRSADEVRQAMLDLIAGAPLEHIGSLKAVFMAHCADASE